MLCEEKRYGGETRLKGLKKSPACLAWVYHKHRFCFNPTDSLETAGLGCRRFLFLRLSYQSRSDYCSLTLLAQVRIVKHLEQLGVQGSSGRKSPPASPRPPLGCRSPECLLICQAGQGRLGSSRVTQSPCFLGKEFPSQPMPPLSSQVRT